MHIADQTGLRYTLAARLGVGIMVGLFVTLLLALPAGATKPTPPLTMKAAFDSANPQLNRNETLRVTLTTTEDYANLAVAVSLPPEIALITGSPVWKGALKVGEPRELVLMVMLKTTGRYAINVDATFDPAESLTFTAAQISLNIIAEAGGVTASMDDFITMDLKRAKTPAEKERLRGTRGIETQTPAGTIEPLPAIFQPVAPKEKPAPRSPESELQGTISVVVSGVMKYQDKNGGEHPIRLAKVKVYDIDLVGEELMGEGSTDANGRYSIVATGGDIGSGPDIKVRVYSAIVNDIVASVGDTQTTVYYMESPENADYTGATLTVSMTTPKPVSGSTTDSTYARVFSVMDAALQFSVEACSLRNYNLLPKIPVVFPGDGTYFDCVTDPSHPFVSLIRKDALDWDVIGHEFGHYLAILGASSDFDTSLGGAHNGNSTIPSNGKDAGCRLALSEGWATFFEIAAIVEPTHGILPWPVIPNAHDRIYHDTEDGAAADDLETFSNTALTGKGQGYACERSIAGMFYDMTDADVDTSCDGLSKDTMNLSPRDVWTILNYGAFDTVGKFYNALCVIVGYDIPMMFWFSQLFAINNIGPELKAPAQAEIVSSAISPEFSWLPNGDPTAGFAHDRFALVFAKDNFRQIIGIKDDIRDTKYTCTEAEWQAITSQSDNSGMMQWAVLGYNSKDPRMPPAWGLGNFLSNVQYFQLRAYHIRLRWNNLGADVDLHLSPPSGSDCAYYNKHPDWGVPGDTRDDPSLDRDCISQCTEENLTLDMVTDPGTYNVWVHYYSDHGRGASTCLIEIFRYGQLIGSAMNTLAETGDRWDVFSFGIGKTGAASIETKPGQVIPGVAVSAPKEQEE